MAKITKEIVLDVARENPPQSILAKQDDSNSRFLLIKVANEGQPVKIPSAATVIVNAMREDGNASAFEGTVNKDGTATVPITNWMLAVGGNVRCSISILDENREKLTTAHFEMEVELTEYGGEEVQKDGGYGILVRLIEESAAAKTACETAAADARDAAEDARTVTNAAETAAASAAAAAKTVTDQANAVREIEKTVSVLAPVVSDMETTVEGLTDAVSTMKDCTDESFSAENQYVVDAEDPFGDRDGWEFTWHRVFVSVRSYPTYGMCFVNFRGNVSAFMPVGFEKYVGMPFGDIRLPPAAADSFWSLGEGIEYGVTAEGGNMVFRNSDPSRSVWLTAHPFAFTICYPMKTAT